MAVVVNHAAGARRRERERLWCAQRVDWFGRAEGVALFSFWRKTSTHTTKPSHLTPFFFIHASMAALVSCVCMCVKGGANNQERVSVAAPCSTQIKPTLTGFTPRIDPETPNSYDM